MIHKTIFQTIPAKQLWGNKDVYFNQSLETGLDDKVLRMDMNQGTASFFGVEQGKNL